MVVRRSPVPARAVALVLHGGAEHGADVVRPWRLAYLRMVPFARALRAAGARHGLEVRLLRNRVRGWNAPALDPVRDARWALERVHAESPGLPVVLVGHSMGGRVALRVADDPAVTGVCALAPWTPEGEPVDPVRGRTVVLAHGTRDAVTSPEASYAYAKRAQEAADRLARFEVAEEGHAMVQRPALWRRLVVGFAADVLGFPERDGLPAPDWDRPAETRLRIRL
ncbi:alpha/beta hydrolase [Prauserella flavalba]|uniref:Alpha/beta hydrolase n=1 Tax=Prauserella flavalba TaxID=1477506 RepID=A0A318M6T1_9PSEU|nr:alpha/beta fold hydrolase [Prauserella flavalba]PXY29806.1 alpha/beta hydrolase [Prauserella flavalba]